MEPGALKFRPEHADKVGMDGQKLEAAGTALAKTIEAADKLAEAYADQFHEAVIVPFCIRHKLSFWSGNGDWWFEPPKGGRLDLEYMAQKWAIPTGNARLVEGPRCALWEITASRDEMPPFFQSMWELEDLLNIELLGSPLGYWVPSSSYKK